MERIWRDIEGYDGEYQVSNLGEVFSVKSGRVLKNRLSKGTGYLYVGLHKNGKGKNATVHRLVAKAFLQNELNKTDVNHIDGNKTNNRVDNLEWCTRSQNMKHAVERGLCRRIIPHDHKKDVIVKDADGNVLGVFHGLQATADFVGVSFQAISRYCKGEMKNSKGYSFEYQKEV